MISLLWLVLVVVIAAGTPERLPDEPAFPEPPAGAIQARKPMDLPAWYWELMVGGYLAHGHRDARWDAAATNALGLFSAMRADQIPVNDPRALTITNFTAAALEQGCADPLIQYLHWRRGGPKTAGTADILQVADALGDSGYSPVLKSYAYLRAFDTLYPRPSTNRVPSNAVRARNAAITQFQTALETTDLPGKEVLELGRHVCDLLWATNLVARFWPPMEQAIGARYSDVAEAQLLLGEEGIELAWKARGSGLANTVSEEGWRVFDEQLRKADTALRRAWQLDPTLPQVPYNLVRVSLGQGYPRKEMERWFSRAQALSSGWYDLYWAKGQYLMPKWHGSRAEVLAFGRQCLTDPNAFGRTRLILMEFHKELEGFNRERDPKTGLLSRRPNLEYYRNRQVWNDIRSSFEAFFRDVPNDTSWHHNYALYAWRAQDWKTLNSEIPKLGPINYKYFGGQEAFDQILADAKAHAGR